MSTFAIVHGAAGCGWEWHLVAAELEAAGHRVVAPDLPCEDESATFDDYVDVLEAAIGTADDLVVVAHSAGGFPGVLAAARLRPRALVLCSAMVPRPGESGGDWWSATGHRAEGTEDDFLHDLSPQLRAEAARHERGQADAPFAVPFPLEAWPDVPTHAVLFADDRLFPLAFMRGLYAERLGITDPTVVPGGHCAYLSQPRAVADALLAAAAG